MSPAALDPLGGHEFETAALKCQVVFEWPLPRQAINETN